MSRATTPSQTIGPFFAFALAWPDGHQVAPAGTPDGFWIRGRVLDGASEPVGDALVETWQADGAGRLPGDGLAPERDSEPVVAWDGFRGFGRSATDGAGRYGVFTVKPGRVRDASGAWQAPHLAVTVLARGLLQRVVTRLYFADEDAANAEDPVLRALTDDRRATLLAARDADGYTFDIRLQGDRETVFFAV
jgi:protocatechuate 3,4-dioxygenase alpha subunit